jgi:hypothetical protein
MIVAFRLFENVAISKGKLLAFTDDRDVPSPEVVNQLTVLFAGVVELLEVIAFPVRGDIESGDGLLATDQEDTSDEAVVVLSIDTSSTEEVFARSLETSEEATNQVVSHEGKLELIVIFVVNEPQGVLLGLVVLPEPGKGDRASILVRVLTLPLVENQSGLAKSLERVLGLGSRLGFIFLLLSRLRSSFGGFLLRLLLLLGGGVLDSLLHKNGVLNNSLVDRLVDHGSVPTSNGRVLRAELLVQNGGKGAGDGGGSKDIGKGQTLTNEVSLSSEVLLKNGQVGESSLGGILNILLVVGVQSKERAVPRTDGGEELGVGIGYPAKDGSVVLLGLAQESSLLVLGGD